MAADRLIAKGVDVALLFVFFHERPCGPLSNSRFHTNPIRTTGQTANSKLPGHKAYQAIEKIATLLATA
jgi:hypothetical protein